MMQIICFSCLVNLPFPSNLQALIKQLFSIVNFDLIDPQTVTNRIFNFKLDKFYAKQAQNNNVPTYLIDSFIALNFDTYNPIKNVDGLFVLILMLLFFILFAVLVKAFAGLIRQLLEITRDLGRLFMEGGEKKKKKGTKRRKTKKVKKSRNALLESEAEEQEEKKPEDRPEGEEIENSDSKTENVEGTSLEPDKSDRCGSLE